VPPQKVRRPIGEIEAEVLGPGGAGTVPRGTSDTSTAPAGDQGGGWLDMISSPRRALGTGTRLISSWLAGIPSVEPGVGSAIGAGIGGAGESLAELIEGRDQDLGAIATSGALGAVPLGKLLGTAKALMPGASLLTKAATVGKDVLGNALKLGGVNAAADLTYRLTKGQLPGIDYDWSDLSAPFAIGAGGGAALSAGARAIPAVGRMLSGGEEGGAIGGPKPVGAARTPSAAAQAAAGGQGDLLSAADRGATGAATPVELARARAMLKDPQAQQAFDRLWGDVGAAPPRPVRVTPTAAPEPLTPGLEAKKYPAYPAEQTGDLAVTRPTRAGQAPPTRPVQTRTPAQLVDDWFQRASGRTPVADALTADEANAMGGERLTAPDWGSPAATAEPMFGGAEPAPRELPLSGTSAQPDLFGRRPMAAIEAEVTGSASPAAPAAPAAPRELTAAELVQQYLSGEKALPDVESVAPEGIQGNYSGESAASTEAMNRASGMAQRGEQFVIYDRTGARRVLPNTPDSVDVFPRAGETKGIEDASGNFRMLDDNGGRPPRGGAPTAPPAPTPAEPTAPGSIDLTAAEPGPQNDIEELLSGSPQGQKILALYRELQPRWAETARGVEDVASFGHVNPNQSAEEFTNRLLNEPPRQLMGKERALRRELEAGGFKLPPDMPPDTGEAVQKLVAAGKLPDPNDPELGFATRELLRTLGGAAVGGVTGGALEPEHPLVGGGLGAILGALVANPSLARGYLPYQYEAMLSGAALPKNIAGVTGSIAGAALEHPELAPDIARAAISPKTLETLRKSFTSPAGETRWTEGTTASQFRGPFTRMMGAVDTAGNDVLQRAGLPEGYARRLTATSEPRSKTGGALVSLAREAPMLLPFARTGVNLVERGLERTPGVNLLPAVDRMTAEDSRPLLEGGSSRGGSTRTRRSLLGLAALAAGAGYGAASGPGGPLEDYRGGLAEKIAMPAAGLYALPMALGAAGVRGYQSAKKSPASVSALRELAREFFNQLPLPEEAGPERYLQRNAPAIGTMFSPVAPSEFDTSGGTFDPMLARIPLLNELLLPRKRKTPGPTARRRRP